MNYPSYPDREETPELVEIRSILREMMKVWYDRTLVDDTEAKRIEDASEVEGHDSEDDGEDDSDTWGEGDDYYDEPVADTGTKTQPQTVVIRIGERVTSVSFGRLIPNVTRIINWSGDITFSNDRPMVLDLGIVLAAFSTAGDPILIVRWDRDQSGYSMYRGRFEDLNAYVVEEIPDPFDWNPPWDAITGATVRGIAPGRPGS